MSRRTTMRDPDDGRFTYTHDLANRLTALANSKAQRTTLAYLATWLFTLFGTPVFRHDARLSVRRGFRVGELRSLLREGGLSDFSIKRRFFYRILLVLSKVEQCTNLTDETPDPC